MSVLNLHHLRLFRAVARKGTLTGAARELNLSQSALSTQIRALEDSLGHDLFERRGRGLVLSEAGRIALDHAEAIFRTADDLTATLRNTGKVRRALRVGALATLSRNFQLRFLMPLAGRPDVEVVLRSGSQADLLRNLEALSLDVVLTNLVPGRDATSPYLVHNLSEQPVSLVGSPEFLGRGLADLLKTEPLILPTPEAALRASFDVLTGRLGVVPRIAAEAPTTWRCFDFSRAKGWGLRCWPPSSCGTNWRRERWRSCTGWRGSANGSSPSRCNAAFPTLSWVKCSPPSRWSKGGPDRQPRRQTATPSPRVRHHPAS